MVSIKFSSDFSMNYQQLILNFGDGGFETVAVGDPVGHKNVFKTEMTNEAVD
jgi:hypothetical protein